MAYISYDGLWRSEFYNIVSAKDKMQDTSFTQLKLIVNGTYKKDEKITTNIKTSNDEDVKNKAYQDTKLSNIDGQISHTEKTYNKLNLHNSKQSIEEVLIERAVKSTIQILFDKG